MSRSPASTTATAGRTRTSIAHPRLAATSRRITVTNARPMASARQDMCASIPNRARTASPARSPRASCGQRQPSSHRASTVRDTRMSGISWPAYQETPVTSARVVQSTARGSGPDGSR